MPDTGHNTDPSPEAVRAERASHYPFAPQGIPGGKYTQPHCERVGGVGDNGGFERDAIIADVVEEEEWGGNGERERTP